MWAATMEEGGDLPKITPCAEHREWVDVDAIPDTQWDQPGRCVASATVPMRGVPDGVVWRLDCKKGCRWASDPTPGQIEEYPELAPGAEQTLGSVGDPTLKDVPAWTPTKVLEVPLPGSVLIPQGATITDAYVMMPGKTIHVKAGVRVKKGQLLSYGIDPETHQPTVTVADPKPIKKGRKNMPKEAKTPTPKRERRRGMVLNRTIGNMQVTLRVEGNVLDIPKEKRETFWQLVDLMKALDNEPPKRE